MRNNQPNWNRQSCLIAAALASTALLIVPKAQASSYTWGSSSTGGTWSTGTNWNPNGVPTTGDSVTLDTATADRTVVYDNGESGSLVGLTMNQSSGAYTNLLDMQRASGLSLTNSLTLGSTTGTTSVFYDAPLVGGSSKTITAPQINLNAGGVLEFANYGNGTQYNQNGVTGDLLISGGTLQMDQGVGTSTTVTFPYSFNGNVTMTSGTVSLGVHQPNPIGNSYAYLQTAGPTLSTADRFTVNGNLTVTGGTMIFGGTVNNGIGTEGLFLSGTGTNIITGLSINTLQKDPNSGTLSSNYNTNDITPLVTMPNGSLKTDSNLMGGFYASDGTAGTYAATLGTYTAGKTLTVGQIGYGLKHGGSETIQLSSNVSSSFVFGNAATAAPSGAIYALDVNGNTLDMSTASNTYGFEVQGAGPANFELLNSQSATTTGVIEARSFNLGSHTGGSSVGPNINLIAIGNTGTTFATNTLNLGGGSGTIDPTSTFTFANTYSTNTSTNPDFLSSNRTIGNLAVNGKYLQLSSGITTGTGSAVNIATGSTLQLNNNPLSTSSLTVNGTLYTGGANGGVLTTGTGPFVLNSGETLNGTGVVSGALEVASGSTVTPGSASSPGKISNTGNVTYDGGGHFGFNINNANGAAGTNWTEQVISSGNLNIASSSGSPFVIDLASLNGGTFGALTNFNNADSYSWTLASADSIPSFDPTSFAIDTTDFAAYNNLGGGSFSVSDSGGDLVLNFTPNNVPEPTALSLMGVAAMGVLRRRRRAHA